jgi:hypothetical protein
MEGDIQPCCREANSGVSKHLTAVMNDGVIPRAGKGVPCIIRIDVNCIMPATLVAWFGSFHKRAG